MRLFRLGPRLEAAAGSVQSGRKILDVGTDHALLPAYLILTGVSPSALCVDIGAGPLKHAAETVARYSLEDRVELRLSDGLASVVPHEADEIVITGMGGELIAGILSAAPWVADAGVHVTLQPQSRSEAVRGCLAGLGFGDVRETVASEGGFSYIVISASSGFAPREPGGSELYFGSLPALSRGSAVARDLMRSQYKLIRARAEGLRHNGKDPKELSRLESVMEEYESFADI